MPTSEVRLVAGLDAISAAVAGDPDDKHQLIAAKCRGLLCGYHERWKGIPIEVLEVEQIVTADLYNIETERRSRTFSIAGKLDLRAIRNGRRVIFDQKTTSEDIEDPSGTYWKQLIIEAQPSHYMWLEWMNGLKADEAVWDVVRKPSISPKQITKVEASRAASSGKYFGMDLAEQDYAAVYSGRESLAMYSARLAYDCSVERPERYFQRRTIPRLDSELRDYAGELWEHSQEIIHARATGRWARNSGACLLYGRPCEFLGICSGHDTADGDNWRKRKNVHSELPGLEGDGRDVLTNSRIRCFQTCRRKHFLRYELGIERVREDESEVLWFGDLWHKGQEAWWNAAKKEQYGNANTDAAGSGLAVVSQ
jgi:hypothetical protein